MPPLNWDAFERLPGGASSNFEMLCRGLIRRHYGRYGRFAALAAQPGVEFHLKLQTVCSLGDPGRWYGWQCRWYDLRGGRPLTNMRRVKIEKAIKTTEKVLPNLTDWVLWTKRPLTKGDQTWFYRLKTQLKTQMQLHLWTADQVDEHLSGDAEILRATYFGELVLNPNFLATLHELAVAPIQRRWQPEVHQTIDAERKLRRMLCETDIWKHFHNLADKLEAGSAAVKAAVKGLAGPLADAAVEVAGFARAAATALVDAHKALDRGDLDLLRQQLDTRPAAPGPELIALPRRLRASRHRAGPSVVNALADARLAQDFLKEMDASIGKRLVAVVADAGCGKTQLAAQLTAGVGDRSAGILLHGNLLHASHSLDDLARGVKIQGIPVPSMEALVAALDAAGQRKRRRLPLVIDGLNEAEDPRAWKGPLASLNELLTQYPYVLVVCTVRAAFADEAVPNNIERLEISDFGQDTVGAIRRHFAHYRINAVDAELPFELLKHPLILRLFCEVTNPTRQSIVGIEAMPGSLTALFDRYLDQAAARVAELAPLTHRHYEQDVRRALHEIGTSLWEKHTRGIDEADLRQRLNDDARPWNESIVRALEQEGVLLRVSRDKLGTMHVTAVFDMLAGHLIADSILRRQGGAGLDGWLHDSANFRALAGAQPDRHPLAEDTCLGLVGLVPRRLHARQLWTMVGEPLRTAALRGAAELEGAYLDADTIDKLSALVAQSPPGVRDLFYRLWQTRGAPAHPLNAEFLSSVLRPMTLADRDLRWTEWVRFRQDEILADLRRLEKRWRSNMTQRAPADRLRAQWVMWALTSTVRELRDQATRTLYWFGRGDPAALFELSLNALAINDPYVPERLLAASYGVIMAHQLPDPGFVAALRAFLTGLRDALTGSSAADPTSHWLARLHVQGMVTLALAYHVDAVPEGLEVGGRVPFAPGPTVDSIASDDPRASEVDLTLHMDFENYTLGGLIDDRRNYDKDHPGHQAAVAHVRGTVWALGWREAGLGTVDKELISRTHRAQTERYGKKYGWIGFYTYAGMLGDKGWLPKDNERLSEVQIDPSFPETPSPAPIGLPIWARPTPADDRRWITKGTVTVPDELLYRSDVRSHRGPWIAVHANLATKDQAPGRRVFGILTALLVVAPDADRLVEALNTRYHPGRFRLPEVPGDYYTFAGEVPWNPEFARSADGKSSQLYRETLRLGEGPPIEVEILAHRYAWESYHSALNEAGGALLPSRSLSATFDLRGVPQSFDQILPDGTAAAMSFSAPATFEGHVLYFREDLLLRYAAGRRLIWSIWGERQLYPYPQPPPDWLVKVQQSRAGMWRLIRRGEELSRAFGVKLKRRSSRSRR